MFSTNLSIVPYVPPKSPSEFVESEVLKVRFTGRSNRQMNKSSWEFSKSFVNKIRETLERSQVGSSPIEKDVQVEALYPGKSGIFVHAQGDWSPYESSSQLYRTMSFKSSTVSSLIQEFDLLGYRDGNVRIWVKFSEVDSTLEKYLKQFDVVLSIDDKSTGYVSKNQNQLKILFNIISKNNVIPFSHFEMIRDIVAKGTLEMAPRDDKAPHQAIDCNEATMPVDYLDLPRKLTSQNPLHFVHAEVPLTEMISQSSHTLRDRRQEGSYFIEPNFRVRAYAQGNVMTQSVQKSKRIEVVRDETKLSLPGSFNATHQTIRDVVRSPLKKVIKVSITALESDVVPDTSKLPEKLQKLIDSDLLLEHQNTTKVMDTSDLEV